MAISEQETYTHTDAFVKEALQDFKTICESRQASLMARSEVFMGKAKFGILGDGKELPQTALARVFEKGDFRSGYYRDQTFMMAAGLLTIEAYFAQLYAHANIEHEPAGGGRLMTAHFSTRLLDKNGDWLNLTELKNSSCDISPTASQMPRLLGLALASKHYKQNKNLHDHTRFSRQGNEVAFGTIGNASPAEGMFWESLNAAGVLQVPMVTSIWDDGYGISVPNKYQITKGSLSKVLAGFQRTDDEPGLEILQVRGWDYEALRDTYKYAARLSREQHIPVVVHVTELTQPLGHSTSGSHERYKSKERLQWEKDHDCVARMRKWLLDSELATEEQIIKIEKEAKAKVKEARNNAWHAHLFEIKEKQNEALALMQSIDHDQLQDTKEIEKITEELQSNPYPIRKDAAEAVRKAIRMLRGGQEPVKQRLLAWHKKNMAENHDRYSSHLYSESEQSALLATAVPAQYNADSHYVDGREVLQACFDALLERIPEFMAFGEDLGRIGDVNQGFAGLQEKYGELRVGDTGIRECTIIGQGIGMAMRGLRPLAEIQYLDYLLYALQLLSDDLATLQYRTKGGQKAPLIVRTRGHRLEGIWHAGSPMGMIIHALRGMWVGVPRNMTQAAGMYNTLFDSDDPALIVECLNGYRLKEKMPDNIADFRVPLGQPEILKEGQDITIVTYGSMCRVAMEAADTLSQHTINCEVIDVQTLLPFDLTKTCLASIKKTNRVIFADEDVPGGASAFMMQQVLEEQGGYQWLDSLPVTIAAKPHRTAYASDGDYYSKPGAEDIFEKAYKLMREARPNDFPELYS